MNGYGNSVFLRTAWEVSEGGAPPSNTAAPLISGTQVVGSTLTTTTGTWIGSAPITYTYQWYRGAALITGATSNTYVLVQADAGNTSDITCKVTATNSKGTATATSNVMNLIYDLNAFNVIVAIQATGVTLTTTQKYASNQLVIDTKNYGVWSKIKALYPFVGGTAAAHKFNWKEPRDLDAAFRLVFSGGWTHSNTGALPNGTNAYATTKFSTNLFTSASNFGMGSYTRTNTTSGAEIGVFNPDQRYIGSNLTLNAYFGIGTGYLTSVNLDSKAFWQVHRTSASVVKVFKNGSVFLSGTTGAGTLNTREIFIGALNDNGTGNYYTGKELAFIFISDGLTDTEATNLRTAVQAFQTTLGRNV